MSKQEFLEQLRKGLSGLPQEDIEERVSFFNEMIEDRMDEGLTEEEAVMAAGPVEEIIEQTVADIPFAKIAKERIKPKRQLKTWEIVLLILIWFRMRRYHMAERLFHIPHHLTQAERSKDFLYKIPFRIYRCLCFFMVCNNFFMGCIYLIYCMLFWLLSRKYNNRFNWQSTCRYNYIKYILYFCRSFNIYAIWMHSNNKRNCTTYKKIRTLD